MVQITFAFVIILGYLLSVGMHETQKQKKLVQELSRRSRDAQGGGGTAEGAEFSVAGNRFRIKERRRWAKAIAARVAAEKKSQLATLLQIWRDHRQNRPLFLLVIQFRDAELIPLSNDMDCLPTTDNFQDLGAEAARVFLVEGQKVSTSEVAGLMTEVIVAAGFDPETLPSIIDLEETESDVNSLYFDRNIPTRENRQMLNLQILADLEEERQLLGDLQYDLVGKIASKRQDKLADLPLADEEERGTEETDLGISMLEDILAGLEERMQLLPEVSDRIRGELDDLQSVQSTE